MKLKFELILSFETNKHECMVSSKNNEFLGKIFWYKHWKCYVWEQERHVIMSHDCLKQVIDYMQLLLKPTQIKGR